MDNLLIINHPRGHIELVIDNFFPCIQYKANIIFPLINRYAEEDEKENLRCYLKRCVQENADAIDALNYQLETNEYSKTGLKTQIRHLCVIEKRAKRNLEAMK